MALFNLLIAFFYLQPSLVITFVPVQIVCLFLLLVMYKKRSGLAALFSSLLATLFSIIIIILLGSFIVPLICHFFKAKISDYSLILILLITVLLYWILTSFFMRFLLRMRDVTKFCFVSSAIAGLSVLLLYYLIGQ